MKRNLLKLLSVMTAAAICMFLLAACGDEPVEESTEKSSSQTIVETDSEQSIPSSSLTEEEPESSESSSEVSNQAIAEINGDADKVGIYSVVVRLTDQAADKGVVNMVYYGPKGSPQENSIVSKFRIDYYKNDDGNFEITTYFNEEVYQNMHDRDEVKVTNTFSADLRAGNVIISYTPDGGDTQEIFRADAEYFYVPSN